jgi:hypothetical protein
VDRAVWLNEFLHTAVPEGYPKSSGERAPATSERKGLIRPKQAGCTV